MVVNYSMLHILNRYFQWTFTGVYGPVENNLRESFWEELGAIKGLWDGPWCVGGDFNEVLFPNERARGGRLSNSMRRYSDILYELDLIDLPLQGSPIPGEVVLMAAQCPVLIDF